MGRKTNRSRKALTPEQVTARIEQRRRIDIANKATEIGVPIMQIQNGDYAIADVPIREGGRVTTLRTLVNRGGTPVARWKSAKLLSDSQVAAIDHCEAMWAMLNGKALVANLDGTRGGNMGNGWAEQEALDDLHRIKGYIPPKWWAIFESVCRFDEPAGFAGSRITDNSNEQVAAARTTVQFVADIIAMKERIAC